MVFKTLQFFFSWKGIIYTAALVATFVLPRVGEMMPGREYRKFPYLVWVWANLDGEHYLAIAQGGYLNGYQPFFPLYPLLMWTATRLTGLSLIITGQIISVVCLLLALFVAYKLLSLDGFRASWMLFLTILFFYPTSFYFNAVYNDSLFFLLATSAIYLARRGKLFWAGLLAGLATLTRLNGLALGFLILAEYIFQSHGNTSIVEQWNWQTLKSRIKVSLVPARLLWSGFIGIVFIPASFLGYLWYIQTRFGDWSTLFSSMKTWDQDKLTFPLQVVWRYIKILFIYPEFHLNYGIAALEFVSVCFYIFLLWYSFRRIRVSYWLFFAVSILIPSLTGTFQGMPRYGLHLYPFFLAILLWMKSMSSVSRRLILCIAITLQVVLVALFTRAYFVS